MLAVPLWHSAVPVNVGSGRRTASFKLSALAVPHWQCLTGSASVLLLVVLLVVCVHVLVLLVVVTFRCSSGHKGRMEATQGCSVKKNKIKDILVCTTTSVPQCHSATVSVYYKMKKAYQSSLKCGTLGGRCGYIVERELSATSVSVYYKMKKATSMSTHHG